jgi:hypothetical protein
MAGRSLINGIAQPSARCGASGNIIENEGAKTMDYHGRIMNIQTTGLTAPNSSYGNGYKVGHRSARHAAAEIVLEAQAEIEALRKEVMMKYGKVYSSTGFKQKSSGGFCNPCRNLFVSNFEAFPFLMTVIVLLLFVSIFIIGGSTFEPVYCLEQGRTPYQCLELTR